MHMAVPANEGGGQVPIPAGEIVEVPDDNLRAEARDTRMPWTAYVQPGTLNRGKQLVALVLRFVGARLRVGDLLLERPDLLPHEFDPAGEDFLALLRCSRGLDVQRVSKQQIENLGMAGKMASFSLLPDLHLFLQTFLESFGLAA